MNSASQKFSTLIHDYPSMSISIQGEFMTESSTPHGRCILTEHPNNDDMYPAMLSQLCYFKQGKPFEDGPLLTFTSDKRLLVVKSPTVHQGTDKMYIEVRLSMNKKAGSVTTRTNYYLNGEIKYSKENVDLRALDWIHPVSQIPINQIAFDT